MTEPTAILLTTDGSLYRMGDAHAVAVDADALPVDGPLVVVVPGADVLLCEVELPRVRQAARRLQAARYALEDRLAAPVEDLHIILGPRLANGPYPAAVVAHARMEAWLQALGPAREAVIAMVPDYLCLPEPDADETVVWLVANSVLVRRAGGAGFACEANMARTLLRGAAEPGSGAGLPGLRAHGDQPLAAQLAELGYSVAPHAHGDPAVARQALLARADPRPGLNLLSGRYARAGENNQWWRPLRATAALAGVWLILATSVQALVYTDLSERIADYKAAAEARFRAAFPGVTTINDLRVQAEQEIRRLRAQQGSGGLFPLLAATTTAAETATKVSIQSLQYRDGALYLDLRGENVGSVEALRAGFEQHPGVALEIQSAAAGSEGVQIHARVSGGAS